LIPVVVALVFGALADVARAGRGCPSAIGIRRAERMEGAGGTTDDGRIGRREGGNQRVVVGSEAVVGAAVVGRVAIAVAAVGFGLYEVGAGAGIGLGNAA